MTTDLGRKTSHFKTHASTGDRIAALLVAVLCTAVLGIATWLSPSPDGHGTHEQLNLPACDWATGFSMPCPTCGMTTSFAWAATGDLASAARVQPFGALLAIGTAAAFWIALHVAITGSASFQIVSRTVLHPPVVWISGVLFLIAWGYKILTWSG